MLLNMHELVPLHIYNNYFDKFFIVLYVKTYGINKYNQYLLITCHKKLSIIPIYIQCMFFYYLHINSINTKMYSHKQINKTQAEPNKIKIIATQALHICQISNFEKHQ